MSAKPMSLILLSALSCAVIAAAAMADSNSRLPGKAESFERYASHVVSSADSAAPRATSGVAARKVRKPKVTYIESNAMDLLTGGRDDGFMLCKKGQKAIGGYFGSTGGVVLDFSSRGASARRWEFGLLNISGADAEFFVGTVCIKGA